MVFNINNNYNNQNGRDTNPVVQRNETNDRQTSFPYIPQKRRGGRRKDRRGGAEEERKRKRKRQ
jgi:hypothetical protein